MINLYIILDKSGSMLAVREATISSLNEYLNTLQNDKNDYALTLTLFDTDVTTLYTQIPLKDFHPLTHDQYVPGGMTALYDAVCTTLNTVKPLKKVPKKTQEKTSKKGANEAKDKNLAVIITDGLENSSREYTEKEFVAMMCKLEKQGNWTFVYLGANHDAWAVAQKYGFSHNNIMQTNSTGAGVISAYFTLATATRTYAGSGKQHTNKFVTPQQQAEVEATK